jgi:hypothetical protein
VALEQQEQLELQQQGVVPLEAWGVERQEV